MMVLVVNGMVIGSFRQRSPRQARPLRICDGRGKKLCEVRYCFARSADFHAYVRGILQEKPRRSRWSFIVELRF